MSLTNLNIHDVKNAYLKIFLIQDSSEEKIRIEIDKNIEILKSSVSSKEIPNDLKTKIEELLNKLRKKGENHES